MCLAEAYGWYSVDVSTMGPWGLPSGTHVLAQCPPRCWLVTNSMWQKGGMSLLRLDYKSLSWVL